MAFVQPKTILDNVLTRIPDNSAAMRAKCLIWLNEAMRGLTSEPREWEFLKKTAAALPITANQITLPVDFGRVVSVQVDKTFLTPDEELTDEEAFYVDQSGGATIAGYTVETTTLTLHPTATGTATLSYVSGMPTDYIDDAIDTIFPIEFQNLLTRSVLAVAYETESDEMTPGALQLASVELAKMKRLDNKRKATPKISVSGYIRDAR
jgi:hypothetical protein